MPKIDSYEKCLKHLQALKYNADHAAEIARQRFPEKEEPQAEKPAAPKRRAKRRKAPAKS